jgi:alanine racemase
LSRSTWIEISTGALERNYAAVASHAGTAVCAVVKANAYGHGLIECARVFRHAGARWLAVTRLEEARALREAGVEGHLLLLAPPPPDGTAEAIGLDCSLALADAGDIERFATAARAAGRAAKIHLKVDTGMGRLGVPGREAAEVARRVAAERDLVLEGLWTHFAGAASSSGPAQLARFRAAAEALGKTAVRTIVHAANSAATLVLPGSLFDMVRVGTLLYGQNPPGARAPFPLEEAFAWYARVVAVRDVEAGATVGYGSEWRARTRTRVGTLAIGYADGLALSPAARTESLAGTATVAARSLAVLARRRPSPRSVLFGGRRAPILGRIAMQEVTVSLEGLPEVGVGDVAALPARRLLVSPAIERVLVP